MRSAVLISLASCTLLAQTYTISTFAGGGVLPPNTVGLSAAIGQVTSVAVDPSGNVFMCNNQNSVVLRLDTKTSILTLLAGDGASSPITGDNGPATSAQFQDPAGIAVDATGALYIADTANHRIRKVSNGVITTVAGTGRPGFSGDNGPATNAQLNFPNGVAVDSFGNIYIADYSNNRIRKVSNGVISTVAGNGTIGFSGDNGTAIDAQLYYPSAVAVDAAGNNLYIADYLNARIRKVTLGVITTVAGTGKSGFSGDNGPATSAQIGYPYGVAVDNAGNIYIADKYNYRIRKVSGGTITTVAGNGAQGFSGDNGPAASTALSPSGVAVDLAGNIYIADTGNERVRKVANGVISTVAGNGGFGDGAPAISALLDYPVAVAADSAGAVYIADANNNRIRKVSNGVIATFAGNGSFGFSGDNGPAASAQLKSPGGIAVDLNGNVYIADSGNFRIREVSNGIITTIAGNGTYGFSGDNGPATSAQLNTPVGLALDSAGNLYFADNTNQRVRKVSKGVITTVAGTGVAGFSGDNGPATSAQLNDPYGVAVDATGNLYIVDAGNQRIRKVSNGVISSVAGSGSQGFRGDNGPAVNASLSFDVAPTIALDSMGNLYIPDSGNNRIRKVSNGLIATVAGNGLIFFGGDSGPATAAELAEPLGIAFDSAGNAYVADSANNRIRVLTPTPCAYALTPTSLQPSASGGGYNLAIQTSPGCFWTLSGLPNWITVPAANAGVGPGTVSLVIAPNSTGATLSATLSIATASISITQPPSPSISVGGIVNAASSAAGTPVAPGSIATAYGTFLLTAPSSAAGLPLPVNLGGLSMQFGNSIGVPLFYAGAGQVNFQVPWELAGQSQASLAAISNGQAGAGQAVSLAPVSPGIFSTNSQGVGQGAVLDASYVLLDSSNPATAGSTVAQIYCTGLGAVTNQPPTGSPALANPLSTTTLTPTVTIGGAPATVMFSGLAPGFVGVYQVNALVPPSSKGTAVAVVIAIGGAISNTVTIAVQ